MTHLPATLRVAFEGNDQISNQGMWSLLEDIFTENMGIALYHLTGLTSHSALHFADIYVSTFCAGMENMCRPEFKLRKPDSLLIVLSKSRQTDSQRASLPCQQNSVFLHPADALPDIRRRIVLAWLHRHRMSMDDCKGCRPPRMSVCEERVADYLQRGCQLADMADSLALSPKTVSSQKRSIMNKFGLHSDAELLAFITHWQRHEPARRVISVDGLSEYSGVSRFKKDALRLSAENRHRVVLLACDTGQLEGDDVSRPVKKGGIDRMTDRTTQKNKKTQNDRKEAVLAALMHLCGAFSPGGEPVLDAWPRTRDVADVYGDSVYVTRYWLGLLKKDGRVRSLLDPVTSRSKVLRWYPQTLDRNA